MPMQAILSELISSCETGERVCLLPISRVLVEATDWLTPGVALFPPDALTASDLRVVEWPARRFAAFSRQMTDGVLELSGDELHWGKGAMTNIDLPEFFGSALLGFKTRLDWQSFLFPSSHEAHLEMLRAEMERCDRTFDLVRFAECDLWTPQKLPGRVGLLADTPYSCGLFYAPEDHESYLIAGEVASHHLLLGIGTDMTDVFVPPMPSGELATLATHALRLYSEALEAVSETSRFMQLMALIEFLADPNDFTKMQHARKAIGRQIAHDKADYLAIQQDFLRLTAEQGPVGIPKQGLRHNIVHFGKRLEDLTTLDERRSVYQRLHRYVGVPISQMVEHGEKDWIFIETMRSAAKVRLGLD